MRIGWSVDCDDDCIARTLMSSMAQQLNWERTTLDYFAFANRDDSTDDLTVQVLVTDRRVINGASNDTSLLSNSITALMDDLETERVQARAEGVEVIRASIWLNTNCTNTLREVDAKITHMNHAHLDGGTLLWTFTLVLICWIMKHCQ